MKKIYYLGYYIYKIGGEFVCGIDNSYHKTLVSAKCHIDYLTK